MLERLRARIGKADSQDYTGFVTYKSSKEQLSSQIKVASAQIAECLGAKKEFDEEKFSKSFPHFSSLMKILGLNLRNMDINTEHLLFDPSEASQRMYNIIRIGFLDSSYAVIITHFSTELGSDTILNLVDQRSNPPSNRSEYSDALEYLRKKDNTKKVLTDSVNILSQVL